MNKKVKIAIPIGIIITSIILLLWSRDFRLDTFGNSKIDWVDCVKINDTKYYSTGISSRAVVPESSIDKKIGKVKFNVSEKVHNEDYTLRNGDATFLEVGTEIFSLKFEKDAVAVKVNGEYFLYN